MPPINGSLLLPGAATAAAMSCPLHVVGDSSRTLCVRSPVQKATDASVAVSRLLLRSRGWTPIRMGGPTLRLHRGQTARPFPPLPWTKTPPLSRVRRQQSGGVRAASSSMSTQCRGTESAPGFLNASEAVFEESTQLIPTISQTQAGLSSFCLSKILSSPPLPLLPCHHSFQSLFCSSLSTQLPGPTPSGAPGSQNNPVTTNSSTSASNPLWPPPAVYIRAVAAPPTWPCNASTCQSGNSSRALCLKQALSGVPVVAQRKRIRPGTLKLQVRSLASLRGSRLWRCHEPWCRSQTQLRSYISMAVV